MTDPTHFTDPKWAAQLTADEEREALAWLGRACLASEVMAGGGTPTPESDKHQATIRRMLARPVMPQEPSDGAMQAMLCAYNGSPDYQGWDIKWAAACRALYAHLTKPKKMKPVFHVTGSDYQNGPHRTSAPITADWHDINQAITALCNDGYQVVTVRREMVPE